MCRSERGAQGSWIDSCTKPLFTPMLQDDVGSQRSYQFLYFRSLLLFLLFWLLADKGWHSSPQRRWDQRAARACNWLLIKCSEPAANSPRRLVICMHSSSAHIQRSKKQQGEGEMKWKVQVNKRTIMWHVQGCNQQLLKKSVNYFHN